MAWSFGDSFDLYANGADMVNSYWDSGTSPGSITFVAGRFGSSQAMQVISGALITKSSAVNDAVHHLVVSFRQTAALSGLTAGAYLELFDGATVQCTVVFRSDGAILLTSGGPLGTTLATYTGAITASSTWYAFEIEVVINNTTGSFAVRKNGNTVNDFSATALNTRPTSTNNYANKLTVGMQAGVNQQQIDDLFWRSDAAAVAWMGDIRCYTRMPASDQSVVFTRVPSVYTQTPFSSSGTVQVIANKAQYIPFTPPLTGTVGSATVNISTASTANIKCAIYANAGGVPTTSLGTATPISAPGLGAAIFTFGTPVSVTAGAQYWLAIDADTTSGFCSGSAGSTAGCSWTSATYASFPTSNPPVTTGVTALFATIVITPATTANWLAVSEAQEDGLTSYVYDSNPGDADFYGIGSIGSTPATVVATVVRGYMQKSDAGTRTAAVQLKSGATTVASPTLTLTTSGWLWAWRIDLTDPNTGAAWTPAAVNNAQIGPTVIA